MTLTHPSQIWETPYDVTDASFPCSVNRTSGPNTPSETMYMINHFLDYSVFGVLLPDEAEAGTTNGLTSCVAFLLLLGFLLGLA